MIGVINMGIKCKVYTSEDISRFIDNELPHDLYLMMAKHLNQCSDCTMLAENYTNMSVIFRDHAHQEILKINNKKLKQNLVHNLKNLKPPKKRIKNISGFFGKNIYFKLASIAAILIISLYTFQGDHSSEPSAIVKSVDTDFASVMIIQTQKERHTIIWFSET